MNTINTVAYIFIEKRRLLLVRAANKKAFYMPGGKAEKGENSILALIREVKEEIAVDLLIHTLKYFATFTAQAYGKNEGINVRIECYVGGHKNIPQPKSEIEELKFFTSDEYLNMPDTAPAVRLIIND